MSHSSAMQYHYGREFLLELKTVPLSLKKPDNVPDVDCFIDFKDSTGTTPETPQSVQQWKKERHANAPGLNSRPLSGSGSRGRIGMASYNLDTENLPPPGSRGRRLAAQCSQLRVNSKQQAPTPAPIPKMLHDSEIDHQDLIIQKQNIVVTSFEEKKKNTSELSLHRLKELGCKDVSDVVAVLSGANSGFRELLMEEAPPDLIHTIINLMARICQSGLKEAATVMVTACSPSFLRKLSFYILGLPNNRYFGNTCRVSDVLSDLLVFFDGILNTLPNTACEQLGPLLIVLDITLKTISPNLDQLSYMKLDKMLTSLSDQLQFHIQERESKPLKETRKTEALGVRLPPDNFRTLSVYPTLTEVTSNEQPFLRPNIVQGAYESVNHYLDVQFRILREDFVGPLREGIQNYKELLAAKVPIKKRLNNIKIYTEVMFVGVKDMKNRDCDGLVVLLNEAENTNSENTKKLMFGTLVCFTADNFNSIIFATVMEQKYVKPKKAKKRIHYGWFDDHCESEDSEDEYDEFKGRRMITVKLVEHSKFRHKALFFQYYTMVESLVYFEPYFHVLNALQCLNSDNFPMSRYIVDVQQHTAHPKYISDYPNSVCNVNGREFSILDDSAWPCAAELGFDEAQYRAFKSAMTKEFVVIQGPPGTGKTFIGLHIAKTLIENANEHLTGRNRQILVVCFTNHALDQFLEGILPVTPDIVRVGGQSKSELLEHFSLKEKRSLKIERETCGMDKKRKWNYFENKRQRSQAMWCSVSNLADTITAAQQEEEIIRNKYGILSLQLIYQCNKSYRMLRSFVNSNNQLCNDVFLRWLEQGIDVFNIATDWLEDFAGPKALESITKSGQDWKELNVFGSYSRSSYAFSFLDARARMALIQYTLDYYNKQDNFEGGFSSYFWLLEDEFADLWSRLGCLRACLENDQVNMETIVCLLEREDIWEMSHEDRWMLYHFWVSEVHRQLQEKLDTLRSNFQLQSQRFEALKQIDDLEILQSAKVIGMTTTGAARLRMLLAELKPAVVIVEEAAEVLESHIVVSLTKHCQHLILIGDHQQLRPTTAVYELARDFRLEISLFERMLNNDLHCEVLQVQHRMRPKVARLIVPAIYPHLLNDVSVLNRDNIRGVTKNVFFITHNKPEQQLGESTSKRNIHEAHLLLALCRYLLQQGYQPDEITVLATYMGQSAYLHQERASYGLEKVKMTVVDNFQGEENKIILLSLVRSNADNNIGFLRIANRVCVALSRARDGFYIVGNMDNLSKGSSIWPKINEALVEMDAIGTHLTLSCQNHPNKKALVACAEDFKQVPAGACDLPCNQYLSCGHRCERRCHVDDRLHVVNTCQKPCTRVADDCAASHPCPRPCGTDCDSCSVAVEKTLPCGHVKTLPCGVAPGQYRCVVLVPSTLPRCRHAAQKPCHADLGSYPCPVRCGYALPCGHTCVHKCHHGRDPEHVQYSCREPCLKYSAGCSEGHRCGRRCNEPCGQCSRPVRKRLPGCDHDYEMSCCDSPYSVRCTRRCARTLACGHPCRRECTADCGHCDAKVTKRIEECGHEVSLMCRQTAQRSDCTRRECGRTKTCGHPCSRRCADTCEAAVDCAYTVNSAVGPVCGHALKVPCHVDAKRLPADSMELLSYCRVPCKGRLGCGHVCRGSCGQCLQGRVHQPCREKCGRYLLCGHKCVAPCAQSCPPCREECRYRCAHRLGCGRKCGDLCQPCKRPCLWKCPHLQCSKQCGQPCDREACYQPCNKKLSCGHACLGFCGDVCPPVCRVCDRETSDTLLDNKELLDSRLVYLPDCKHTVASHDLDAHLERMGDVIALPTCPRCEAEILTLLRLVGRVKQFFADVWTVKNKVFTDAKKTELGRKQLARSIEFLPNIPKLEQTLSEKLLAEIKCDKKSEDYYRGMDTETLKIQIATMTRVSRVLEMCSVDLKTNLPVASRLYDRANWILAAMATRNRLGSEEVGDLEREVGRLRRVWALLEWETSSSSSPESEAVGRRLFTYAPYTDADDRLVGESFAQLGIELRAEPGMGKTAGYARGAWARCRAKHVYVVDSRAKCPHPACARTVSTVVTT